MRSVPGAVATGWVRRADANIKPGAQAPGSKPSTRLEPAKRAIESLTPLTLLISSLPILIQLSPTPRAHYSLRNRYLGLTPQAWLTVNVISIRRLDIELINLDVSDVSWFAFVDYVVPALLFIPHAHDQRCGGSAFLRAENRRSL